VLSRAAHGGCVARARLAARAEVAAAAGNNDAPNRLATPPTRFAGSLVNTQSGQEISGAPFNGNVVPEACALKVHSLVEDNFHGPL